MATRVFLLSGDEKAVHAITQILDELEISFEHSSDPTFSLKRLAGQHFDLLVVDCDNVQSATQVFNSARASSLNKGSIAIAIVEGKAGVPNAFRLGASLVLTKPVSLEQVRNTLRTGVGMTRKDGAEARPAAPAIPAPPPHVPTIPAVPTFAPPAPTAAVPVAAAPASPVAATPIVPPIAAQPQPPTPIRVLEIPTMPPAPAPIVPLAQRPEVKPIAPISGEPGKISPAILSGLKPPVIETKPVIPSAPEIPVKPVVGPIPVGPGSGMSAAAAAAPAVSKFDSVFSRALEVSEKSGSTEPSLKNLPTFGSSLLSPEETEVAMPAEDTPSSLREQAVPAFGGLGQEPFAGIESSHRGRTLLIILGVVVLTAGGLAAAWMLKPGFRNAVLWEYGKIRTQFAGARSKPAAIPATMPAVPKMPAAASASTTATSAPAATTAVASTTVPPTAPTQAATPTTTTAPAAPASTPSSTPSPAASGTATRPATPSSTSPAPAAAASSASASAPNKAVGSASAANPKNDAAASHPAPNPAATKAAVASALASAPPVTHELLEVPEDYADDQVVRRVHPIYPKQARAKNLQGTVVLQAIVDKQGKVNSLQLVSGDPLLAQAAADAVKQWRYKPYSHNGEPSDFQTRVTVDFHLP